MTINLKQITVFDSGNILLDKINYNFDQLIVNGGGPKGYIGPDGSIGTQGFEGSQGFKGPQGSLGFQGTVAPDEESFWISIPYDTDTGFRSTLFPKKDNSLYSSIIAAGYTSDDINNQYYNQQSSNGIPTYQWVVNRKDNVLSNISLKSVDTNNIFNIRMCNSECSPLNDLYLEFKNNFDGNSKLNLESDSFEINDNVSGGLLLKIDKDGGEIRVNSTFKDTVRFNKQLSVKNSGADFNKIVTAVDNSGLVIFKTATELGGAVKFGTIISILPSIYFNIDNFVGTQSIDASGGSINQNEPLRIKIGAGVNEYIGWYICNGETWTNGTEDFVVPDINGFKYIIVGNPASQDANSQGSVNTLRGGTRLIGGLDFTVTAAIPEESTTPEYNITSAIGNNTYSFNSSATGTTYIVKKLPQIIYLGVDDLYWSQLGINQSIVGDYSATDYLSTEYRTS